MSTGKKKTRKLRGHVSHGHGRVGKHRKHPGGRGNAGGLHHHRINFDKYHPGYFGKLGMRNYHLKRNSRWCPIINLEKLWSLVGEKTRLKYKSDPNGKAPVIDVVQADKSILCKPTWYRTDKDKTHLNRVIGGLKCFRRYPSHVKAELAAVTYFVYYGPNRTIVREGDPGLALYFIITGEVSVQKLSYDPIEETDTNQEIGRRGRGGMFGEVSLLHGVPRTATIVTLTHCELLKLKKEDFDVVLKATVQEEWDNIKEALNMFTYFQNWDEISKRECCILSKIQEYKIDETILGDGVGLTDYVYFVINGSCRIIHHLMVTPYYRGGKKFYKLYEPKPKVEDSEEVHDGEETSKGDVFRTTIEDENKKMMNVQTVSRADILSKSTVDDENRETKNVLASMKIAEQLSTANLPPEVEICFLHKTACFGLEELFEHRRVAASTEVRCLLIPRYWLFQKNVGNIWNRIVQYLNSHIPSTKEVFEAFINNPLHTSNSQTNRFRDLSIKDVHFTIHTRRNPYGISITTDNVNHVSKVETVLLIAGWNQDTLSNSSYFRNFTYIYLKEKNINVIQTHADHVLTYYNLDYVYQIGKIVGNLLVKLDSENKVNLTQMHLIGVGVGSHIAGIAADYASSTIPKRKVDRISALSPTYTSFLNGGGFIRQLQASDARYVDIYVTSISGTQEPTGNGTFYPNGGETQPLCPVCGKDSGLFGYIFVGLI
ncbi:hypothetical protein FQR65_LT13435 [Abscondita terminalis]|nr:hypothetical protein FQR65_LT13435 [Abscondita terminalis]